MQEITPIKRAILLSIEYIKIMVELSLLDKALRIGGLIQWKFISLRDIPSIKTELWRNCVEINNEAKKSLTKVFFGLDYEFTSRWIFSHFELSRGYVELLRVTDKDKENNPIGPRFQFILFLSSFKDHEFDIKPGDIKPIEKCHKILTRIPPNKEYAKLDPIIKAILRFNFSACGIEQDTNNFQSHHKKSKHYDNRTIIEPS
jgi:hypothetical protein